MIEPNLMTDVTLQAAAGALRFPTSGCVSRTAPYKGVKLYAHLAWQ